MYILWFSRDSNHKLEFNLRKILLRTLKILKKKKRKIRFVTLTSLINLNKIKMVKQMARKIKSKFH